MSKNFGGSSSNFFAENLLADRPLVRALVSARFYLSIVYSLRDNLQYA